MGWVRKGLLLFVLIHLRSRVRGTSNHTSQYSPRCRVQPPTSSTRRLSEKEWGERTGGEGEEWIGEMATTSEPEQPPHSPSQAPTGYPFLLAGISPFPPSSPLSLLLIKHPRFYKPSFLANPWRLLENSSRDQLDHPDANGKWIESCSFRGSFQHRLCVVSSP